MQRASGDDAASLARGINYAALYTKLIGWLRWCIEAVCTQALKPVLQLFAARYCAPHLAFMCD